MMQNSAPTPPHRFSENGGGDGKQTAVEGVGAGDAPLGEEDSAAAQDGTGDQAAAEEPSDEDLGMLLKHNSFPPSPCTQETRGTSRLLCFIVHHTSALVVCCRSIAQGRHGQEALGDSGHRCELCGQGPGDDRPQQENAEPHGPGFRQAFRVHDGRDVAPRRRGGRAADGMFRPHWPLQPNTSCIRA